MKYKLLCLTIIAAISVLVIKNQIEKKAEREAQAADTARVQQEVLEIEAAISDICKRRNAITDWAIQLSRGEPYRYSPILTIELEKLWQNERPILFIGSIMDIASADGDTYQVLVERSLYSTDYMFATELRLSVIASKNAIDSLLQEHPELLASDGYNNGVAVIAKIHGIHTSEERDEYGENFQARTGHGHLLDIVYTGDALF